MPLASAFHHLALMALRQELPAELSPGAVRAALSAVLGRTQEAPETFDEEGFLQIGLCGHQSTLGESYIYTGSLYFYSTAFRMKAPCNCVIGAKLPAARD